MLSFVMILDLGMFGFLWWCWSPILVTVEACSSKYVFLPGFIHQFLTLGHAAQTLKEIISDLEPVLVTWQTILTQQRSEIQSWHQRIGYYSIIIYLEENRMLEQVKGMIKLDDLWIVGTTHPQDVVRDLVKRILRHLDHLRETQNEDIYGHACAYSCRDGPQTDFFGGGICVLCPWVLWDAFSCELMSCSSFIWSKRLDWNLGTIVFVDDSH